MPVNTQEDRSTALATPFSDPATISKDAAGEFARRLGSRRRSAGAPVRKAFVSTVFYAEGTVPPLAALLRGGGRGGQTRLKLYLSLLWLCAKAPYEADLPARAWAALLGLQDHDNRGTRRVHAAVRDLQAHNLITVRDRGGHPNVLRLLSEHATGELYTPPSDIYNRLAARNATPEQLHRHQYFRIPSSFWTDGHIRRLGGPGVAMLLVLLCEQRAGADIWFTPGVARDRFALAPSTRTAGLQQLRKLGLITTQIAVTSEDGSYITFQRRRNVHQLHLGRETPPPQVIEW